MAKNYLDEDELKQLNLIVNQYLEFAELQAMQRKPMRMADWIAKLHGFLSLNDRDILNGNGKVSQKEAERFAIAEFEKYKAAEIALLSQNEDELEKAIKQLTPGKP